MTFSVKLQPIDWKPLTFLEEEWQRYLTENVLKFQNKVSCS